MEDEIVKVKILLMTNDTVEWQWMGKLSRKHLKLLTQIADILSDNSVESEL